MVQKTAYIAIVAIVIVIIAASAVYLVTQDDAVGKEEVSFKYAVVMPGFINDISWNQIAYEGLLAAERELGIEADYSEDHQNPPDAARVAREYADAGYDLVNLHSVAYEGMLKEVASEFPDTAFTLWAFDYDLEILKEYPPNVGLFFIDADKTTYLVGALAGLMTKTNKIGYIGPWGAPYVVKAINQVKAGAEKVNPDAEVYWVFTGDYNDTMLGKEAALSLIDVNDCDIIVSTLNLANHGIIEAVEEYEGVYIIPNYIDLWDLAPGKFLSSLYTNFELLTIEMIKAEMEGEFRGKIFFGGFPEYTRLGPYHGLVPPEISDRIDEITEDIVSGEIEVPVIFELP